MIRRQACKLWHHQSVLCWVISGIPCSRKERIDCPPSPSMTETPFDCSGFILIKIHSDRVGHWTLQWHGTRGGGPQATTGNSFSEVFQLSDKLEFSVLQIRPHTYHKNRHSVNQTGLVPASLMTSWDLPLRQQILFFQFSLNSSSSSCS